MSVPAPAPSPPEAPRATALFGLALAAAAVAGQLDGAARTAAQLALSGCLVLGPLWPLAQGQVPAAARGLRRPQAADLVLGVLVAGITLTVFALVVARGHWPLPAGPWRGFSAAALAGAMLAHTIDVVLPEEVFFRGYLQPAWAGPGGPEAGLGDRGCWLQAAAFGALHVVAFGGAWGAFDRALPGLVFGWLRARTGAVWAPVLVHLAYNAFVFLA